MQLSPSAKFKFLVGDIGYASNNYIGTFYDHYRKYKFQNVSKGKDWLARNQNNVSDKGNNKITELRTILQRESQIS